MAPPQQVIWDRKGGKGIKGTIQLGYGQKFGRERKYGNKELNAGESAKMY